MELAERALAAEGKSGLSVYELELEPFLEEGIPYLMDCGFNMAVFLLSDGSPTMDIPAK